MSSAASQMRESLMYFFDIHTPGRVEGSVDFHIQHAKARAAKAINTYDCATAARDELLTLVSEIVQAGHMDQEYLARLRALVEDQS